MSDKLQTIARSEQRRRVLGSDTFAVYGADVWRTSELTWLDHRGKPHRAHLKITVPCQSKFMVESKSLKLYLGSFAMHRLAGRVAIQDRITQDLADALETEVQVELSIPKEPIVLDEDFLADSHNLDYIPLREPPTEVSPAALSQASHPSAVSGSYHTHLFRCLCPITAQPDYATMVISFKNAYTSSESLLSYLVSYREHQGFHESTVEQIYTDLLHYCEPKELMVLGSFSRRGGIDICPIRSSLDVAIPIWRSHLS